MLEETYVPGYWELFVDKSPAERDAKMSVWKIEVAAVFLVCLVIHKIHSHSVKLDTKVTRHSCIFVQRLVSLYFLVNWITFHTMDTPFSFTDIVCPRCCSS